MCVCVCVCVYVCVRERESESVSVKSVKPVTLQAFFKYKMNVEIEEGE